MELTEGNKTRIGEMLAELPAHSWTQAATRLQVIARYLASDDRTAEAARREASSIGLGPAMFYRLARMWSAKEARPRSSGVSPMSPALEDVVRRAIGNGQTSQAQVARTAAALAEFEGLPAPGRNAVRLRYVRQLAGRRLRERMDVDANLLMDRAHLDFLVDDGVREGCATLICVFDLADGSLVKHALTATPTTPRTITDLIATIPPGTRIAFSLSDQMITAGMAQSETVVDGQPASPGRWRVGSAIRAALGPRLGRLRLLEHPPLRIRSAPIDAELASLVVDELLRRSIGRTDP